MTRGKRLEPSVPARFFSAPLNFEELRSITEAKVSDTRNQVGVLLSEAFRCI